MEQIVKKTEATMNKIDEYRQRMNIALLLLVIAQSQELQMDPYELIKIYSSIPSHSASAQLMATWLN